jgi:hypothetical protein
MDIKQLQEEREKLIHDLMSAIAECIEEFNNAFDRVLGDKLHGSLETDDAVEDIIGKGKGDPDLHGYPGEEE